MKNKDIAKYFYEVIISDNLLDEISKYTPTSFATMVVCVRSFMNSLY